MDNFGIAFGDLFGLYLSGGVFVLLLGGAVISVMTKCSVTMLHWSEKGE